MPLSVRGSRSRDQRVFKCAFGRDDDDGIAVLSGRAVQQDRCWGWVFSELGLDTE